MAGIRFTPWKRELNRKTTEQGMFAMHIALTNEKHRLLEDHRIRVLQKKAKLREISYGENAAVCRYDENYAAAHFARKRVTAGVCAAVYLIGILAAFRLLYKTNPELLIYINLALFAAFIFIVIRLLPFLRADNYIYNIIEKNGKTVLIKQSIDPLAAVSYNAPEITEERLDRIIVSCRDDYGEEVILTVPKGYPKLEKYLREGVKKQPAKILEPTGDLNAELEKGREALIYDSSEEFEERLRAFFAEDGELSINGSIGECEEWVILEKKNESYMLSTKIGIVFAWIKEGEPEIKNALEGLHVVYVNSFNLNQWKLDRETLPENLPEIKIYAPVFILNDESMSLYDFLRATTRQTDTD